MRKYISIFIFFFGFFFTGCKDEIDSSPPLVAVTFPTELWNVSEVVLVEGIASDNDSVKYVELWIDSLATGIIDSTSPYHFFWNTTIYLDSSLHSITLFAEDQSQNTSKSDPVIVVVNNSLSSPVGLEINSISYSKTIMEILYRSSVEDDFNNYELLFSESEEGLKNSLGTFSNRSDTLIQIFDFNPSSPSWYWLKITDIYGYSTIGPGYYILDSSPEPVSLEKINFNNNIFNISWTINNELDFESYSIYQSQNKDMSESSKIFEFNQKNITSTDHQNIEINQYYYYQIKVEDYWGLYSLSNIEIGTSWYLFNNIYNKVSYDYGRSIVETSDTGYVVVGNTSTIGNNYSNLLLLKVNQSGVEEWFHNLTFSPTDRANMVLELPNTGFIIVGKTQSLEDGSEDILILKTNQSGHVEWSKNYGSFNDQSGDFIQLTLDGGYIICGQSVESYTGFNKLNLLKIDSDGDEIWNQSYGGNGDAYGYSVISLSDGSYLAIGMTRSLGELNGDAWLIKIDSDGNEIWNQSYGGNGTDIIRSIVLTDNGYLLAGNTNSYGNGNNDIFIIKVDQAGVQQWSQTYGGNGTDVGRSISKVIDGGYIITGYTDSFGNSSSFNIWLIKIDENGNLIWDKTYGENGDDRALDGHQTLDGGYVLTGFSDSNSNNTPSIIIIKTDKDGKTTEVIN